jgi:hypothetical protein
MKNRWKLILIATSLAVSVAQSTAQNTVLKVVQDLNFKLTGYYQMSPTENPSTLFRHAGKITVNNKDIINLLESEVNIIFTPDAKLKLISLTPVDPNPRVIIRDTYQGTKFDTDVTEFFSAEILTTIEDTKINKNPVKTTGKSYDVISFELKLTDVNFRLVGFGNLQVKNGKYENEPVAVVHTGSVDSSGSGVFQVSYITGIVPVALTGTVSISGSDVKAETQ